MKMTSLKVVYTQKGITNEYSVEKWFQASENPTYLALITKPSPGLWEALSQSREVVMEIDGKSFNFKVPYRIEVGESTIFFVTPSEPTERLAINQ